MKVALAHLVSAEQMGQQMAETGLIGALADRSTSSDGCRSLRVASLRQALDADRRLPLARVQAAPWAVQRAAGAWTYRGFDLVHRMDLRLPPAAGPEVLTVHDVAPLRYDDEGPMPRAAARSAQRASVVVCPSAFAAGELRDHLGARRVEVIPNGLDAAVLEAEPFTVAELGLHGVPSRFVLHTGGATKRKNLTSLAAAWPAVRAAHREVFLVLCGPDDNRRTGLFGDLDGTLILGKVPREVLVRLMAAASAVVVPSLYEGFGLPALEGLACGVPVVAANTSSLGEVTGGHASLVPPNADGLADGLVTVLDGGRADPEDGRRFAQQFTWEASARSYLRLYREVLGS